MSDRPTRQGLLLRFFPEIKEGGTSGDTEGSIALNVRACEAILTDLIGLYDDGHQESGPGILVLRLHKEGKHSGYLQLLDIEADLSLARTAGDKDLERFLNEALDAIRRHNPNQAALVALVDNTRAQVIPIARDYPAGSIQAMFEEVTA
ncbi:MAG: hypothetical protein VKI63_05980 [Cyanobium sp.]|nr:hypothetical protein [Cyanobium sp.]